MILKLTQVQKEEIRHLHQKCPTRRFADKLKALLLLDKGFSCVEVGDILLLDDDTIRKYRDQYLAQGAESLLEDNNKGTLSYLTTAQLEELDTHLEENVYSDSKGIRAWVANKFNVEYSASGILALLDRMGFGYKKPVLTPCKADLGKQEKFVEEYPELKNNLPEKDQIYFVDCLNPPSNTITK